MDITTIIELTAALIAALLTTFALPYIKSRTTALQRSNVNALIKTAVFAAEQLITGSGQGEKRREYVLSFLSKNGVKLDASRLNALIEAAVFAMKNGVL